MKIERAAREGESGMEPSRSSCRAIHIFLCELDAQCLRRRRAQRQLSQRLGNEADESV